GRRFRPSRAGVRLAIEPATRKRVEAGSATHRSDTAELKSNAEIAEHAEYVSIGVFLGGLGGLCFLRHLEAPHELLERPFPLRNRLRGTGQLDEVGSARRLHHAGAQPEV